MSIETQKVIWKNIDGQTTEVDKVKIDSLLAGGGGQIEVDLHYDGTSEHAQSGKAVAEAIAQSGGGGGGGGFSDIEEGQLPVLDGVIWSKHSNAKTAVMGIAGIVRGYENSVFYSLHTPSPVVGEFDKGEKVSFSYSNTAAYPHDYLVTTKALVDYVSENGSSGGGGKLIVRGKL